MTKELKEIPYPKLTIEQKEIVRNLFYDRSMTKEERTYKYAFGMDGKCHYATA